MRTSTALSAFSGLAAMVAPGLAGVVIESKITDLRSQRVTRMTTLVEADRMRTDIAGADGEMSVMILRRGQDFHMIVLDRRRKEYHVMDRASLRQMQQQVGAAMAELQRQLKDLPPEQRALMEKMMGKNLGGMAAGAPPQEVTTYRAAGAGNVSGRACKKYDELRGAQKIAELCTVDPGSLGLTAADMTVFEKLSSVLEEFSRGPGGQMPARNLKLAAKQVDGFPIEYVAFDGGRPASRYEVQQVTRRSFSEADFSTGDAKRIESPFAPSRR
ncbi:MAG: hypothetical protein RMK57_13615 [Bryobacterales bacterium]|nr:hypothetical protein [Bryobacteraceae bacterium]MDW8355557.1 hypothetical protein [Bryobacterales bacterium]